MKKIGFFLSLCYLIGMNTCNSIQHQIIGFSHNLTKHAYFHKSKLHCSKIQDFIHKSSIKKQDAWNFSDVSNDDIINMVLLLF
jgi:hypothetical protein